MDANVLDVYRVSPNKSILNIALRSKVLRPPVYATSTKASITQMWIIEAHGALVRIAVVNCSARSVTVEKVEQRLEEAVVKSKGLFQSGSVDNTGLVRDPLILAHGCRRSRTVSIGKLRLNYRRSLVNSGTRHGATPS